MALTPFLSTRVSSKGSCSLCNEPIKDNDTAEVGPSGLKTLKALADRWAAIDNTLCSQSPYTEFKLASTRLSGDHHSNVMVHKSCRINFRTRVTRLEAITPKQSSSTAEQTTEPTDESLPYRISRGSLKKKRLCFVCNVETANDVKQFNDGGLGRCSEDNAFSRIKKIYGHKFEG